MIKIVKRKQCGCGQIAEYRWQDEYFCHDCAYEYVVQNIEEFVDYEDIIYENMSEI